MTVLAIHTAQAACDLALVRSEQVIVQTEAAMRQGQDAALPDRVTQLLETADESFETVSRLAVVVGPGSFTGVRIGVAYARGLALALELPCLGITSNQACWQPGWTGKVLVALQAKRRPPDRTFWVQTLVEARPTGPPEEWPLDQVAAFRGSMFADVMELLDSPAELARPQAANAGLLAERLPADAFPPVPAYGRAPDALLPGGRRL